ncbi:MAG TPA: citrate synthase [Verrucomicrobia bacterium]|nr:citrate synthase [Verrucomicrobiota bacterium]HCG19765.1 citrate synthase [Verrucomicrobiota bacterium]
MLDENWLKKQAATIRKADTIDPSLWRKYNVKRGLRNDDGTGVLVGLTTIGNVHGYVVSEGEKQAVPGELFYRGINVGDIAAGARREHRFGYEEAAYLLLFGDLPTCAQLEDWNAKLGRYRRLSDGFKENAIMSNPSRDVMNAMARAILFSYAFDESGDPDDLSVEKCLAQSVEIIGCLPTIAAYSYQAKAHYHLGQSLMLRNPDPAKSTAENILSLIREDGRYTKLEAETLDLALILHAEHGGGNNSSFTTHVVTSAYTDIYSSVAASILSLKGRRHGGANLRVMRQMDEIRENAGDWRDPSEVEDYLRKISNKKAGDGTGLIYGLGHAVYTISDPRAQLLKVKAEKLAREKGRMDEMRLFELVEELGPSIIREAHPRADAVCANVDLYSGFVYEMLGIPKDLYTPLFAVARCVSWCAHRMEELVNQGPIIRPAYKPIYHEKKYVKLADR